ncbi:MAG: NUMOD3 domain-containing DNA-binding protein [Candidatus Poribacteria bacterium]|nr:NUMOD3 domain-containing DNA-binding protein [Candidatus Poribacteria bacterium]
MGSIYKITNTLSGESYIGQCRGNVNKRYNAHIRGDGNKPLKEAIDKYGIEHFTFKILHDGILDELLDDYEEAAIAKYNTFENGYNETPRSSGNLSGKNHPLYGKPRSEEEKRKISESAKASPLVAKVQKMATEAAAKKTKGVPRSEEIRRKISISHRKSDYTEMPDFFLSLPADMHSSIKVRLLREQFPDVSKSTLYFRISKWTGVKTKKQHPNYPEVYEFFTSLPADMPLPKKRHLLHKQFPNVRRHYINRWLNKWSGTKTLKRHPDYSDANDLFLSLPAEMSLSEKRCLLYEQFPNVKRDTIRSWIRKWQTELTPKGEQK